MNSDQLRQFKAILLGGSYELENYRTKLKLVRNSETPDVVGRAEAALLIADERYMKNAVYEGVEKVFLYHQQLMLAIQKEDALAEKDEIDISEVAQLSLIGRSNPMGFNDWLTEIMKENGCTIQEDVHCDYLTFLREWQHVKRPFLMNSFGLREAYQQDYLSDRKVIPVCGKYTERDIYLWYDGRIKKMLRPFIKLIEKNAKALS